MIEDWLQPPFEEAGHLTRTTWLGCSRRRRMRSCRGSWGDRVVPKLEPYSTFYSPTASTWSEPSFALCIYFIYSLCFRQFFSSVQSDSNGAGAYLSVTLWILSCLGRLRGRKVMLPPNSNIDSPPSLILRSVWVIAGFAICTKAALPTASLIFTLFFPNIERIMLYNRRTCPHVFGVLLVFCWIVCCFAAFTASRH